MKTYPLDIAQEALADLLEQAQSAPLAIARDGRTYAVLVSVARHEGMRARRTDLEFDLLEARAEAEKLGYQVESLSALVEDLRRSRDDWRALAEKLRHFVPPGADAFLLDEDMPPEHAKADIAAAPGTADADPPAEAGRVPLETHTLTTPEGRRAFLVALRDTYGEAGLLMAASHLWDCLGRPKALHAERMAAALGLGGRGKAALRRLLARFIAESVTTRPPLPLPPRDDFPDEPTWARHTQHRIALRRAEDEEILVRWEAILTGQSPDDDAPANGPAQIVKGPWRKKPRRKPAAKEDPAKPAP